MYTLFTDLRYALRMLLKNPGFTLVAMITLALGIGGNTAIFSIVDAVLIRPLPYHEPDRLVAISEFHRGQGREISVSWWNFRDWRDQNQVFEQISAVQGASFILTEMGEPERIVGLNVSASFFATLRSQPALGRDFLSEDDAVGANRTVIISHALWQRRFSSDPAALGKTIELNSRPYTVIGVLPSDFRFFFESDIFAPIGLNGDEMGGRGNHPGMYVVARLKSGITIERARADMDAIAARLEKQYPESNSGNGIRLVTLAERFAGSLTTALFVLLGAVGFVLLIACANVANLLLARAATRRKEVAIRTVLGAQRGRIIRQMLTESVLLALLGAALGLLLAEWGLRSLVALIPENIRRVADIRLDASVLGFTVAVSLGTAVIFGLAPAFQSTSGDLQEGLKEGGRTSVTGFRRLSLRNILVASEIALALMLLIGAGLTIRSFVQLQKVNPGFRTERLLTMPVNLPGARYPKDDQRVLFFKNLLDRIRSLPGVEAASGVTCLPLIGGCWDSIYLIEGRPIPRREDLLNADFNTAQPGYFHTMGIPILKGRDFDERDLMDREPVLIINESFARQNWPNEDPLGKRVKQDWPEGTGAWMTVIGVVGDVKRRGLDVPFKAEGYKASRQTAPGSLQLVIRTSVTDPQMLAQTVRREIQQMDANLPVFNVRTMDFYAERTMAPRRFPMLLLTIFAAVALVLAAVGIYGVMSYSVTQRTHEMGIRIALGARAEDVRRLVVRHGFTLALAGILAGLAGAFALTHLLSTLLFGVEPTDPLTFGGVSLLLIAIAGVACYLPARRATRVDPIIALRYE